jgi:hypothetical protein
MDAREEHILTVAEIVRDSAAMNEAALAGDFEEVRFRNALIVGKAGAAKLHDVVLAAAHLQTVLGPQGSAPCPGYGDAMLRIARELDNVGFEPL